MRPARSAARALLAFAPCWVALGAAAQAVGTPPVVPRPSELTPAPPPQPAPELPPPAPPRELAKPEDDLRIDVQRYAVPDDAPEELRAALPRLTAPYTGRGRSFEDLVSAAAEVTRFVQRELGWYLGYAYLPEQQPEAAAEGATIRIALLEGRLDEVLLQWRDDLPVDRAIVEAYLARLVPGSILRVRDVERVAFLVGDLRGISTRFEVRAGRRPGTATLVVTPRPESLWSGRIDADANGSRYLGSARIGGLVQRVSPFGRGDGLTATGLVSTTGGLGFALLGYTTPLGADGLKTGVSLSTVRYRLDKDEFPLDLQGSALTTNVYATYPVMRSRNLNLFGLVSGEHKSYTDRQRAVGFETDKRVNTIALGLTGDFRDSLAGGGVNTFDLSLIGGRVNYPDGRPGNLDDAPNFRKLTLGFTRLQDLVTGRVLAYLALRGQWAGDNLDTTEQFRLGGPDGVRAFAPGEGTGDSGLLATVELRLLPPESWLGRAARDIVASVFYDTGHVRLRTDPAPVPAGQAQDNGETLSAAGLGLAWVSPGCCSLRLSVAKPIQGTPRSDTRVRDPRVYLAAGMVFE